MHIIDANIQSQYTISTSDNESSHIYSELLVKSILGVITGHYIIKYNIWHII